MATARQRKEDKKMDNKIIVRTKELLQVMIEIANEEKEAVEITIGKFENINTGIYEKCITFATLECGGEGYCGDFDRICEMTDEEIENIP